MELVKPLTGQRERTAAVTTRDREREAQIRKKCRTTLVAWGLLLPSLLFLCIFTLYPIASSAYNSLFKDDLSVIIPQFVGIANYTGLLADDVFAKSFLNNLLIAAVTIPASIGLAIAMAMFANRVVRGKWFVRVGFFYPTILPMVAVANIWLFIYTPIYGLLGHLNPTWRILGNPDTAIWGIIAMLVWKQAGYIMIFYMSGLQGISREVYEAVRIDGAGPLKSFRYITWPLLRPTTLYVAIISLTNAYKLVDHLYIMTKGGPNNTTNMLLYYIYQVGFDFWDVGKASAMTVLLVAFLLLLTCVYFYTQDTKTHYS